MYCLYGYYPYTQRQNQIPGLQAKGPTNVKGLCAPLADPGNGMPYKEMAETTNGSWKQASVT